MSKNFKTEMRKILQMEQSPLSLKDGHWKVENREEFLTYIATDIFDEHLDKLKKSAIEVLTEIGPQFNLPKGGRHLANLHGKTFKYSEDLREGLATTLAILAVDKDGLINCSGDKVERIIRESVSEILQNPNWKLWAGLNDLLPILAEAAPDEFLNAVENVLLRSPDNITTILEQEETPSIFKHFYTTGLLEGLESLAWSEEYLVRVSTILAEMDLHDSEKKYANKSMNSLTMILLPQLPQTLAPFETRLACIKAIERKFPDIAWKIILNLLSTQSIYPLHKPQWRNPPPEKWETIVDNKKWREEINKYVEIAITLIKKDPIKIEELIDCLNNGLPPESQNTILEYLASNEIDGFTEEKRLPIWERFERFRVAYFRNITDGNEDTTSKINDIANKLTPQTPEGLAGRFFKEDVFSLYRWTDNWEKQREKLQNDRKEKIEEILNATGIEGVVNLSKKIEDSNSLGWTLGIIPNKKVDLYMLPKCLTTDSQHDKDLIKNFIRGRLYTEDWQWVNHLDRNGWSSDETCEFLMLLPPGLETWKHAEKWLRDNESDYWKKVIFDSYHLEHEETKIAVDKLMSVGRARSAIDLIANALHGDSPFELDTKITSKALLAAVGSEVEYRIDPYHFTKVIHALQEDSSSKHDNLAKIEWEYLPLLDSHDSNGTKPKSLMTKLSTDPDFFCEVICHLYRAKGTENDRERTAEEMASANKAYNLLEQWDIVPGMKSGKFDSAEFDTWLDNAKQKCQENGRLVVALQHVGKVLFHSLKDPNGLWISEHIAGALDQEDADDMRTGYSLAIINSRGAYVVDPTGKAEEALAEKWFSNANAVESEGFPKFALTLRQCAEAYMREARDNRKELDKN